MSSLVDICIEAVLADEFWRIQRKQIMVSFTRKNLHPETVPLLEYLQELLPEHLANILLDSLLQQKRVNHVQLGTFAPCATSIRLADQHHVGDGGAWLAAISRFRAVHTLHLQQCKRLRDDRLALLAPFSSTLCDLNLNACTRLTPRAGQHLSVLTCLTSLDLSGTALEVGPLLSLTRLASLRLVDMKVGDRDCAGIAALTQLTELDLRATSVSDTGVQGLSRLLRLHRLDVTWTQATAPPALSSLTNLHMENCWVGGEVALRVLHSTRFPNLRELHMSMTQFDDAGIELLRAFCIDSAPVLHTLILSNASLRTASFVAPATALCRLDLSGVQFEERSWEMLSALSSLQSLVLQDSSANNDVVKCLTDLTNLRMLSLKSTEIDDAALPLLQSLKGSLTSLDISGNNITGEQAPEQSWGMLHQLHTLKLLNTRLSDVGSQALGQLGTSLTALHIGSNRLTNLNFLRSCRQLHALELDKCTLLTAPHFRGDVICLRDLEALIVNDCAFVGKEAVVFMAKSLPNLRHARWNNEVLFNAMSRHSKSRTGRAALSARMHELAIYDERYCYTNEELFEVRSSKSVPGLDQNGALAAILSELELMPVQEIRA